MQSLINTISNYYWPSTDNNSKICTATSEYGNQPLSAHHQSEWIKSEEAVRGWVKFDVPQSSDASVLPQENEYSFHLPMNQSIKYNTHPVIQSFSQSINQSVSQSVLKWTNEQMWTMWTFQMFLNITVTFPIGCQSYTTTIEGTTSGLYSKVIPIFPLQENQSRTNTIGNRENNLCVLMQVF